MPRDVCRTCRKPACWAPTPLGPLLVCVSYSRTHCCIRWNREIRPDQEEDTDGR